MKKKQTKHFVPDKDDSRGGGTPACNGFQEEGWPNLIVLPEKTAKTRRQVTCGNCQRTRVFRKLK